MTLGEQIKAAREARHLSQEALAELLGVSRQAVSKWENGTAVPQGANRAALGEILELDGEPEPPAPKRAGLLLWLGWAAAGVLLLILLLQPMLRGKDAPAVEEAGPALSSIRFYDATQEEVLSGTLLVPEYNVARMESILLEWTGEAALERVKLFRTPNGERTELAAEFIPPVGTAHAMLLPADALVRDGFAAGYFELHFAGGLIVRSEDLRLYWEPGFEQHAYLDGFDGKTLLCDPVEWIEVPGERANELGLTDEDAPNGFVLYNEQDAALSYPVSDTCAYTVLDGADSFKPTAVDGAGFRDTLTRRIEQGIAVPYIITVQENEVIAVQEQYVP